MATIKDLREKAKTALQSGRAILDDYEGKALPPEQEQAAQAYFDEVDGYKRQISLMERQAGLDDWMSEPTTHLPMNGGKQTGHDGDWLTPILPKAVKALGQLAGWPDSRVKASPVVLGSLGDYDAGRDLKHRFGTALYWKYGREFFTELAKLPREPFNDNLKRQVKDLATAPGGAGGYLVSQTMLTDIIMILAKATVMRRIATVLPPVPQGSVIIPTEETDLSDPEWTHEVGEPANDEVKPFGQRALTPHPLAKQVKIARPLLRAGSLINVETWVLDRLARKFTEAGENGYITGTGSQQPQGLLKNSKIKNVETAGSNTLTGDDLINWVYQLDARYLRRNPNILCNIAFVRKVRLLRSDSGAGAGTGNYLWQPGLSQGMPNRILDFVYEISDFYPTGLDGSDVYEDNATIATIGDFTFYHIVDSLAFEVQRLEELFARNNQVGFIGRMETDGMVTQPDAFLHLKVKA